MGLEFKINNLNLVDDIEAELSKKLKVKISFDTKDEDKGKNNTKEEQEIE